MRAPSLHLLAIVATGLLLAAAASLHPTAAHPIDTSAIAERSLLSSIAAKAECVACEAAVTALKKVVLAKPTEAVGKAAAVAACIALKVSTANICQQIIPEFAPWIFDLVNRMTPQTICVNYLNAPCGTAPATFQVTFPKPKPSVIPAPKRTGEKKYFLQLSDWHYDDQYTPGLEADCGEPLCCRPPNKSGAGVKRPAGKWGDYNCDLYLPLGESLLRQAAKVVPKIDFAILTGDVPAHNVWQVTQASVTQSETTTAAIFRKYFDPVNVTVYPAVGNHDSAPPNSFPPANVRSTANFWLYDTLATQWSSWLPQASLSTVRQKGTYSVIAKKGLRLLSINTIMCYKLNWYLLVNSNAVDQDGVLAWMITELQAAEDNGERVIIIGHIAPGNPDCDYRWSQAYNQIIERYSHLISGGFFGHTHTDFFQIHYTYQADGTRTEKSALVVDYISPSVTTFGNLNPGFRLYEVDGGSYEILNTRTFIADLSQQASWTTDANWVTEYDAKSTYGTGSETVLDAAFWHRVTDRFLNGDRALYSTYDRLRVKSVYQPQCNDTCIATNVCSMRSARQGTPCVNYTVLN